MTDTPVDRPQDARGKSIDGRQLEDFRAEEQAWRAGACRPHNIDEAVAHLAEESPRRAAECISRFSLAGLTCPCAQGWSILIWAGEWVLRNGAG